MLNAVKSALCGKKFLWLFAGCLVLGTTYIFAEPSCDDMGGAPQLTEMSFGDTDGMPQLAEVPHDEIGEAPQLAEMQGGEPSDAPQPQFAEKSRGEEMKHEMGKGSGPHEDVGNIERYLDLHQELNLTPEQTKTLEKIRYDYKKDAIKREADMKILRLDLMEIIRQKSQDFSAAREKVKQISAQQLDSKLAMIDAMEKGYNTLTKEQQDKLLKLRKERKESWAKEKSGENK